MPDGFVYRDGEVPPLTEEARTELADLGHACDHQPAGREATGRMSSSSADDIQAGGRETTPTAALPAAERLSNALDAAKQAVQDMRLDLAVRRDSMLTPAEMVAALDAMPNGDPVSPPARRAT